MNPGKVKEKLVGQLKTRITDLEKFIDFIQRDATVIVFLWNFRL